MGVAISDATNARITPAETARRLWVLMQAEHSGEMEGLAYHASHSCTFALRISTSAMTSRASRIAITGITMDKT